MSDERTFEYETAVRKQVPLLVGLVGPSNSGKTFSALRLATGMARVTPGDIALIDTENGRATHYAKDFTFKHVPFAPPFSPVDYLKAIQHCFDKGATTIIVDSGSHCWEGEGGVLEWHDAETERIRQAWNVTAEKAQFPAWAKPKQAYQKLVNKMLQMKVNLIWCFRAKHKSKPVKGQGIQDLGFMSIAGSEMMWEFPLQLLLPPGSAGVPQLLPELVGEKMMVKVPGYFQHLFADPETLSEDIGQQIAEWAKGDVEAPSDEEAAAAISQVMGAASRDELRAVMAGLAAKPWAPTQRGDIREAKSKRWEQLAGNGSDEPEKPDAGPCLKPVGDGECNFDTGHEGDCAVSPPSADTNNEPEQQRLG